MFKSVVLFVVLAVVGCAFADKSQEQEDREFVDAIKVGFDRSLAGKEKAEWLGSGTIDVISTDYQPNVVSRMTDWDFENQGYPDGSQWLSKVPVEELRKGRKQAKVVEKTTMTWTAWVNEAGIIQLALNGVLEKNEADAINAVETVSEWKSWAVENDFYVFITYCIYCNDDLWIMRNQPSFSILYLGLAVEGHEQESLKSAMKLLAEIMII
jgi:hypothetical protein